MHEKHLKNTVGQIPNVLLMLISNYCSVEVSRWQEPIR